MSVPLPDTEFVQLQDNAAAALSADALFTPAAPAAPVPVYTERIGDIVNKIEVSLGRLGICAVVLTPLGKLPQPDISVLTLNIPVIVQISETVIVNQGPGGSQIPALALVKTAMRLLHHRPHGVGSGSPRAARFQLTETPFTLVEQDPILTYHVNLVAFLTLQP